MSYLEFKTACKLACHERSACKDGYAAMLKAQSYPELLRVWRDNWQDIVGSKFLDIIKSELQEYYIEDREEFHRAGFFFNESADRGICLITDVPDMTVTISGACECYVEGYAHIIAEGVSKVWNKSADADIILQGYSTGYIYAGSLTIRERATAHTSVDCECYGSARVFVFGDAVLTTHGHRRIFAGGNSKVNSFTFNQIELSEKAQLIKR